MNPIVLNTIDEIVDTVKWVTSIPRMVNEGIVADEGNVQENEGADSVADALGDVFLDEVFEDDVLGDVELQMLNWIKLLMRLLMMWQIMSLFLKAIVLRMC